MKLSALSDAPLPDGAGDPEITGLTADSRAVRPGYLFAALQGVRSDGAAFIPAALEAGAAAVLAAPDAAAPASSSTVVVRDANPRLALARMAARFFPAQPREIVAVTGTNGKSSTVEFLRQIWAADGRAAASLGTLGARIGADVIPLGHTTPDPIAIHQALADLAARGVTDAALEASSHGLVQHRMDAVRITAAGFTNLSQDHLDYHGTLEAYFEAKMRLFRVLAPSGAPAVVNVDGDFGRRCAAIAREAGLDVRTVGWSGKTLKIVELTPRAQGQTLVLRTDDEDYRLEIPLAGEFQALNVVQALALAEATGVARSVAFDAALRLEGVAGRLQRAGVTETGAAVYVDYAHTPDGLDKALRALRPHAQGRLVIVFGCGGDRDPSKREPMGAAAARLADAVIVTDDNPRTEDPAAIRAAARRGAPLAREIGDRAAAIRTAVDDLGPGDALLIAGKGHETGQIFADRTDPFDDVAVARAALAARAARA